MKVNELRKHLNEASKEDLVKQILELFKKNTFVKDYYCIKYDAEHEAAILEKHKDMIKNEFFPNRGFGKARLSVAKKCITEFKKLSTDKVKIADLMLFYVEIGVQFTNGYGDIDGPFYTSMEGMYEQAVKYIIGSKLESKFIERCLDVVNDTNGIGWGFHDQLRVTFDEYLGDENA